MTIDLQNSSSAAAGGFTARRDITSAMLRGARSFCPSCGSRGLFKGYLKVADHCPACGEAMHHQRADDAPPYFTMLIVGHVIVGGVLMMEQAFKPSAWLHAAIWLPLTLALSLWLLPRIKGALIGLQWALRMHGFGGTDIDAAADADAPVRPPKSF